MKHVAMNQNLNGCNLEIMWEEATKIIQDFLFTICNPFLISYISPMVFLLVFVLKSKVLFYNVYFIIL